MIVKKFSELTDIEINTIINEHYNHWVKFNPKMKKEDTIYKFTKIYTKNILPFGISLFNNDNIMVGFCVLKYENLKKYPELYPWISDLLIFEKYRKHGYGTYLINYSIKIYKELGYNKVYIWTDQVPNYYKKLGFKYYKKIEKNEGGKGDLFYKEII